MSYPDADKDTYLDLFKRLQDEEIGADVGEGLLTAIKRRKEALKLSEALFKVSQGQEVPDLEQNVTKFLEKKDEIHDDLTATTTDLEALIHDTYQEQGFRWRLNCLNKSLGSLRRGDFGFIFARPETGKTTFLASESTCFLDEPTASVAWFN